MTAATGGLIDGGLEDLGHSRFRCSVCGQELHEERQTQICMYCGTQEEGEWLCPDRHYLCEECRTAQPAEIIERVCCCTREPDPIRIADLLMKHPQFKDYGPEHHLLVAPVVLAALRNQGLPIEESKIQAALRRTEDIPVAVCGTRVDCGACVGAGCAVSLLTGATYRSGHERSLALAATGRALLRVAAAGGSRCCKQSVYLSLQTVAEILRSELGLMLALPPEIYCSFSRRAPECKQERCAFYRT